ncbi:MAG: hypothetical protein MI684_03485, partial [Chlorobiales bacterium]|nr:hypothetical protein [Chlorobiales bacterium]
EIPREVILHAYRGDLHKLTRSDLDELLIELERLEAAVEQIDISNGSDNLVKQELYCTMAFLKHACLRWEWVLNHRQGEVDNQQTEALIEDIDKLTASLSQVWSRRNRIGGLRESVGRLEKLRVEYLNPSISEG